MWMIVSFRVNDEHLLLPACIRGRSDRKIHLDQLCCICYTICWVIVRDVPDCGSFSAAFLFPAWQFSLKSLGLLNLEHLQF
jgi:hypothetical protein